MLSLAADGFEWDAANLLKCRKHRLSPEEIEAVFQGDVLVAPDLRHSALETRFIAIGRGHGSRPLFVAFTLRRRGEVALIRPISARYMHRKEIVSYEKASSTSED